MTYHYWSTLFTRR